MNKIYDVALNCLQGAMRSYAWVKDRAYYHSNKQRKHHFFTQRKCTDKLNSLLFICASEMSSDLKTLKIGKDVAYLLVNNQLYLIDPIRETLRPLKHHLLTNQQVDINEVKKKLKINEVGFEQDDRKLLSPAELQDMIMLIVMLILPFFFKICLSIFFTENYLVNRIMATNSLCKPSK